MKTRPLLIHLREQVPVLRAIVGVALRSGNPITRSRRIPSPEVVTREQIAPASRRLVDDYVAWSGAPASRYRDRLPTHFCSHWAFPMLAKLGGQAPYNVLSVLNQGLRFQIKAPLPRGVPLQLRGNLAGVDNDGKRVRIHSRIVAGTAELPEALIFDSYSAVPMAGKSPRKPATTAPEKGFRTIGTWSAAADEGLRFALLTGDFNPIHTLPAFARRTRFRGCILHGFAAFARSFEILLDAGNDIREIDIRFIKPLPLPSLNLEVQVRAEADGRQAMRLCSSSGEIHLAGHFSCR